MMTYTRCNLCGGSSFMPSPASLECVRCPCARSKTPGWAETGITLGQIERAVAAEKLQPELLDALTEAHTRLLDALKIRTKLLPLTAGDAKLSRLVNKVATAIAKARGESP